MKKSVCITIDADDWKRFQLYCIQQNSNASEMIRKMINRVAPTKKKKGLTLAEEAQRFALLRQSDPDRFQRDEKG